MPPLPEDWVSKPEESVHPISYGFTGPSGFPNNAIATSGNGTLNINYSIQNTFAPPTYWYSPERTFTMTFWYKNSKLITVPNRNAWISNENYLPQTSLSVFRPSGLIFNQNGPLFYDSDPSPVTGDGVNNSKGKATSSIGDSYDEYSLFGFQHALSLKFSFGTLVTGDVIPAEVPVMGINAPVKSFATDGVNWLCTVSIKLPKQSIENDFSPDDWDGGILSQGLLAQLVTNLRIRYGTSWRIWVPQLIFPSIIDRFSALGKKANGDVVGQSYATTASNGRLEFGPSAFEGADFVTYSAQGYLKKTLPIFGNQAPSISLIGGDVDGDNEIGPSDFEFVIAFFGKSSTDSDWNLPSVKVNPIDADFDRDGEIGPAEFEMVTDNFGLVGDE